MLKAMEDGRPSATAQGVAAMRAAHLVAADAGSEPRIFEDPYALAFAGRLYQELDEQGRLGDFFQELHLTPVLGQILGRARYCEEALEAAMGRGVTQYAIVGAGFDSFVLRRSAWLDSLTVVELDHAATQGEKLRVLTELGFTGHRNVHFEAVDFEREPAGEALLRSGLRVGEPVFVSWLGVVSYLTEGGIYDTLRSLHTCTAPDSEIVFDFPIARELLADADHDLADRVQEGTASLGELRRIKHDPDELRRTVESLGYEQLEELDPAAHRARYFEGRRDGLGPNPEVHIARYRRI